MTYIPGGGGGGGGAARIATSGDAALNGLADGQVLAYDAALQKWENAASAGGGARINKAVVVFDQASSTYPNRPIGYESVEWIGPVNPGSAALVTDTWINTSGA